MRNAAWLLIFFSLVTNAAPGSLNWQKLVTDRLPQFGHRNWIVIADSAYPEQSSAGIETVVAGTDQMTVLSGVMGILSHARHVTPTVFVDDELHYLDEKDAPGIDVYRQQLHALLLGKAAQPLPHQSIIDKLDQVSQKFRVLIIKTNMTLPYTSVFLQLDCAYWPAAAEQRLRERMAKVQK